MKFKSLGAAALAVAVGGGLVLTGANAPAEPDAAHLPNVSPLKTITWHGQSGNSSTGAAMANTFCDYTGDGTGDVVVSAWMWDRGQYGSIGATYVIPGGSDKLVEAADGDHLGDIDSPHSGAYRIEGAFDDRMTGFTVNCLGDTNGDGNDDFVTSNYMKEQVDIAYGETDVQNRSREYLGENGLIISKGTDVGGNRFSNYSNGVGDINGDGLADIGTVTPGNRSFAGQVLIVAGKDDIATRVANPDSADVITTINGVAGGTYISNVSPAGDVNGDGLDDILLSGYTAVRQDVPEGITATGMAWVVFGQEGGLPREINLAELGDGGFTINGPERGKDRLGVSMAPAGDLNGDGFDDLLIGADGANTAERAGAVFVLLGADSTDTVYTDPDTANGEAVYTCTGADAAGNCGDAAPVRRGYWINGVQGADHFGYAVAATAATATSSPLLVVGAYDAGENSEGAVYAIDATAVVPAADAEDAAEAPAVYEVTELLAAERASVKEGTEARQRMGRSVSAPGDLNGDGFEDIAWGADDLANRRGLVGISFMQAAAPEQPADPEPTDPVETEPVETEPVETDPASSTPAESDPVETTPAATDPVVLQLADGQGYADSLFTINGLEPLAGQNVDVWFESTPTKVLDNVQVPASGTLTFQVPSNATVGAHNYIVTAAGDRAAELARGNYTVLPRSSADPTDTAQPTHTTQPGSSAPADVTKSSDPNRKLVATGATVAGLAIAAAALIGLGVLLNRKKRAA